MKWNVMWCMFSLINVTFEISSRKCHGFPAEASHGGHKAWNLAHTMFIFPSPSSSGESRVIPCPGVTRGCRRTHLPRGAARVWRTPPRKRRRAASARRPRRFLRPRSFSRFVILHRACPCRGRIWNWHITRNAPIRNIEIFECSTFFDVRSHI